MIQVANKVQNLRQSGVALILVLFLVAIVSLLAVNASEKTYQLQHRLSMQKQQQAILSEQAALEAFAFERYSKQIQGSKVSHPNQAWQQELTFPFGESQLNIQLLQQPSCLNLNSLRGMKPEHIHTSTNLQQLLSLLENINSPNPLADIEDILSVNEKLPARVNDTNPIQAKQYLKQTLSKRWASDVWQELSPFVCYLPSQHSRWNINDFDTSDAPLLKALFLNQLQDDDIRKMTNTAQNTRFESNHHFWQQDILKAIAFPAQLKLQLRVKSEYYWLNMQISRSHSRQQQWYFLQQQNSTLKKLYSYRM